MGKKKQNSSGEKSLILHCCIGVFDAPNWSAEPRSHLGHRSVSTAGGLVNILGEQRWGEDGGVEFLWKEPIWNSAGRGTSGTVVYLITEREREGRGERKGRGWGRREKREEIEGFGRDRMCVRKERESKQQQNRANKLPCPETSGMCDGWQECWSGEGTRKREFPWDCWCQTS